MRISLSLKFALLSTLLVLVVAGATTYVLVYEFGDQRRRELVAHDRELARTLASLRTVRGAVDFATLESFVSSADKVDLGLVYALELDDAGKLRRGALNPRLFAALDAEYRERMLLGRSRVLEALASDEVDRQGRIKEYANPVPSGQLRLGFDFHRIDRQIRAQSQAGLAILVAGLLIGVIAAALLARHTTRPIRKLARAMEAVAGGDMNQTVEISSHDELASLARSFNQMMRHLRDVRGVREVAAGYLSPEVLDHAMTAGVANFSVEERAVTVLILRLHGLRGAGRKSSPRDTLSRLNAHIAPVLDALLRAGGTVVTLSATTVQAVWGAPRDQPNAELRAVQAVIEARELLEREAKDAQLAGLTPVRVSIGLCTGRAAIGNVGSTERHSFAVVGEPVDFAFAIEALAEPGEILISEATYTKLGDQIQVQAAAPLMLEQMDEAIPLYRVV